MACPASAHLLRVIRPMGEAAGWGTLVHAWKESGVWLKAGKDVLRRDQALRDHGQSRAELWPAGGLHEVSYALNTKARVAERFVSADRDEREAWKLGWDSDWLTGTNDWEGEVLGDPWVSDLKTGRFVPDNPWDAWQLKFYAACAAILSHADHVHVSIDHWPRYPADGPLNRVWAPEPITKDEIFGSVLPQLERKRQEVVASWDRPDARPGEHCTYCDAKAVCPALVRETQNPFFEESP